MKYYKGHELDEDLPVDLGDQFFLPNTKVLVSIFLKLVGGINRAYMNWLIDDIKTNRLS